jgi:hypothetical protein
MSNISVSTSFSQPCLQSDQIPRLHPPPPKAAATLDELADCLLATEDNLAAAGLMAADWEASGWREAWRGALRPGGAGRASNRAAGAHLGALSECVALPEHTWPRDAFMHTVETYRWAGLILFLFDLI